MTSNTPTWAVIATVDEPPALVQAFVAWHLSMGAAQVFIYCDNPADPVRELLAHLSQVTVVMCDDAHWQRVGKSRPRRHQVRQVRNAQDAYRRVASDWLLHCDADEFVVSAQGVGAALGAVPDAVQSVAIPVAERIYAAGHAQKSIFDGRFRRPFHGSSAEGRAVFGPDYALTNRGLTGHAHGKAFSRVGYDLRLSIHRPRSAEGAADVPILQGDASQFALLHFEGLTSDHWVYKLKRMAKALAHHDGMPPSKHRARQFTALQAEQENPLALHDRLKVLKPDQVKALADRDLLAAPVADFAAALDVYFPDDCVDLSVGAFDAWIRSQKPGVLDFKG